MPNESSDAVQVEYTPEFKRNLRVLARKYRHVRSDVQPVIDQLQAGKIIGDRIPMKTPYALFKVRVRNRDIRKGKRSGYRLIYHLKTPTIIILVTIYSKSDQEDVLPGQIRRILIEFDKRFI